MMRLLSQALLFRSDLRRRQSMVAHQSGYFDGAINCFDAKRTMWRIDPGDRTTGRLRLRIHRSGRMIYLRHEILETSNEEYAGFHPLDIV
jgi:hypothetical protein